ncbi:MAG TPA: TetR/AcrR family transcriptional regulator [Candidatus Dormibacteraeota bacterium]|jgi:AcrR family transcriptional regulator
MSPRTYQSERRQAATNETRTRILDAARSLLSRADGAAFTIDSVAEQANVARMTVYYQFGSKPGLIAALSDDLASRGGIGRLPEAFKEPDPIAGLEILTLVFMHLWESERHVIQRLRGLSMLDPDFKDHEDRNQRRRHAITVLLRRFSPPPSDIDDKADLLTAMTSFETYETLAAGGRGADACARLISAATQRLLV